MPPAVVVVICSVEPEHVLETLPDAMVEVPLKSVSIFVLGPQRLLQGVDVVAHSTVAEAEAPPTRQTRAPLTTAARQSALAEFISLPLPRASEPP
jgi:hypothetical protein